MQGRGLISLRRIVVVNEMGEHRAGIRKVSNDLWKGGGVEEAGINTTIAESSSKMDLD